MNTKKAVLYIYSETPMHVGTGTGLGAVDMPIQREKHTYFPIVQSSGVKGALRNTAELGLSKEYISQIFGGATGSSGEDFAGAMSPSDARILLFPVRALKGVFVWITSPTVLERFKLESSLNDTPPIPESIVQVSDEGLLINRQVMLEEYTYQAAATETARAWAEYLAYYALNGEQNNFWQERLRTHLVILPDDEFRDFVRYSTDIVTRIHIDDTTKTVKDGQLFTQELLPADSLLYSFVHISDSRGGDLLAGQIMNTLLEVIGERLQIGADVTVGRGRVRLNWQEVI